MEKSTNGQSRLAGLESQLERLLARDLWEMGYQARMRHQQRIEKLRAQLAAMAPTTLTEPNIASPPMIADQPTSP